jgi:tetratricopeptide (TPR) repeat protein
LSTDWEHIKSAIAWVMTDDTSSISGTAFFVGGNYALTALHVVADTTKQPPAMFAPIRLAFLNGHTTQATLVKDFWDTSRDFAVLECADPPNVPAIECSTNPLPDIEWRSFGYPKIHPEGKTIVGRIRDIAGRYEGARVIELFCEESTGRGAPLHGLSGAPCLVNGAAVGILRATLVEETIDGRRERKFFTQAGTVYACPSKAIIDFQIANRVPRLPDRWLPEIFTKDFIVFLSSSEGKYKKLEAVAERAHDKLKKWIGKPYCVTAADAFTSRDTLLDTVSALCKAEVVVFDATEFEPAVMLLAGIRAVVRRDVTILSVGGDYALGDPLKTPFNVTDANIVSHSAAQSDRGQDPVDLLAGRIQRGLKERELSTYVDNAVYETIRRLPADRRGIITKYEGVLVLCPFDDTYNKTVWEKRLQRGLKHQWERLRENRVVPADPLGVARSFELNSPRLITHAIYENIRRAQSCVVDLTDWSGSVMFELGVRLAVSREGTSCLLSKDWEADLAEKEAEIQKAKPRWVSWAPQCRKIIGLLVDDGGLYDPSKDWEEEDAYSRAYGPDAVLPFLRLGSGAVHATIETTIDHRHEPAARPVYRELMDSAELFGKAPGNSKPVGLYPGNLSLTNQEEEAEFDRLLTAWFHLYHRHSKDERSKGELQDSASHISQTLLARHADRISLLRSTATTELTPVLKALIDAIGISKSAQKIDEIRALKRKGTALRNIKDFDAALSEFDSAIDELKTLLGQKGLNDQELRILRVELADTYGMKGGTYRRMVAEPNRLSLALAAYRLGRDLEEVEQQSTYNTSNVIILAVTHDKRNPLDPDLREDISRVIEQLEKETEGPRADEWWAWSDLAQFLLLKNDLPNARESYRRGLLTGPTAQELKRHLEILHELREATRDCAKELSNDIETAVKELEEARAVEKSP